MRATLVDSNVLLDIATNGTKWFDWSSQTLKSVANESELVTNPLIYAEVSVDIKRIEDLEAAMPSAVLRRVPLPFEAWFMAGKAYLTYRRQGGARV